VSLGVSDGIVDPSYFVSILVEDILFMRNFCCKNMKFLSTKKLRERLVLKQQWAVQSGSIQLLGSLRVTPSCLLMLTWKNALI
jgi:hypothetical protein